MAPGLREGLGDRVDPSTLNKLKWRCRRGLLENDLLIERFFARHGCELTQRDASALMQLMNLSDPDLLSLLLGSTRLEGEMNSPDIHHVLTLLQQPEQQR